MPHVPAPQPIIAGACQVAGEMFVRRGLRHEPFAREEMQVLLIVPGGMLNTVHAGEERTARNNVRI